MHLSTRLCMPDACELGDDSRGRDTRQSHNNRTRTPLRRMDAHTSRHSGAIALTLFPKTLNITRVFDGEVKHFTSKLEKTFEGLCLNNLLHL